MLFFISVCSSRQFRYILFLFQLVVADSFAVIPACVEMLPCGVTERMIVLINQMSHKDVEMAQVSYQT